MILGLVFAGIVNKCTLVCDMLESSRRGIDGSMGKDYVSRCKRVMIWSRWLTIRVVVERSYSREEEGRRVGRVLGGRPPHSEVTKVSKLLIVRVYPDKHFFINQKG